MGSILNILRRHAGLTNGRQTDGQKPCRQRQLVVLERHTAGQRRRGGTRGTVRGCSPIPCLSSAVGRSRCSAATWPGPCCCGFEVAPGIRHYTLANTSVLFVPPKPKLFDITVTNSAGRLSRTIGKPSARGSSSVMWAEPAAKPWLSISRL